MIQTLIFYGITLSFLIINFCIITDDIKNKIIKNKNLGILFFISFLFTLYQAYYFEYNFVLALTISVIAVSIGFLMYSVGAWGAGDSKYFIVLAFTVSQIGLLVFIGNIALTSIFVLFWLFLWKILLHKSDGKYFYQHIQEEAKGKKLSLKKKYRESKTIFFIDMINVVNTFFLIFLVIRTIRYIILEKTDIYSKLLEIGISPLLYIIIGAFFLLILLMRKIYKKMYRFLKEKRGKNTQGRRVLFNNIAFIILLFVLYKDYTTNPESFFDHMYQIMSYGLLIYITVRILFLVYKKTFIEMERVRIDIKKLEVGDSIDKKWFDEKIRSRVEKGSYSRHIRDSHDREAIKKYIGSEYPDDQHVVISHSIAFSWVIFVGFMLSYIFGNFFLVSITYFIKEFFFRGIS